MKFEIEMVVYLYIGICICMLVFNCILIAYRRTEGVQHNKHYKYYYKQIAIQMEYIKKNEPVDETIQNRMLKKLKRLNHLQAFHTAITELMKTDKTLCHTYLKSCKTEFTKLTAIYRQRDDMQKAYFAYIMSEYKLCAAEEQNIIVDFMRQLVNSKSAYCRENALKALYRFGDIKNIFFALKLINDNGIFHHTKLITDGLLSFEGDHEVLASAFVNNLKEFNLDFQLSLINYVRVVSGSHREKFYELLMAEETDREIKIGVIRYFGKYHYEPVKNILLDLIQNEESKDWEIVAVACTVIREYKGRDTIDALILALNHQNWYVRYNAAESLNIMETGFQDLASVYNSENRYAREMLEYQRQRSTISKQAKMEVAVSG